METVLSDSAAKPDSSALEVHLGYWMRRISNHVSSAFAKALQARQVSVAEWVVLRELYDSANRLINETEPPALDPQPSTLASAK